MSFTASVIHAVDEIGFADRCATITEIGQNTLTADGPHCQIGDICTLGAGENAPLAEVVALGRTRVELSPLTRFDGIKQGDPLTLSRRHSRLPVGDDFAGRCVNALGLSIDGGPATTASQSADRSPPSATSKTVFPKRVPTGFRAIDTMLPLAQGQRTGIFAASGVGKTTLVEQLSQRLDCDKIVICMIGERGREVERIWRLHAGSKQSAPVTIVAATSDESASLRVRAMRQALALCEEWRERGEHVVLLVDSVTRLAMALREIGLAAGEPPALRSYTPNVFAALPSFVERCGAISGKGAITAIFTVLSETDDVDDPIVETMKSLLDGHIVLSRELAERSHFPAIDIRASISRVTDQLLDQILRERAQMARKIIATHHDARAMIESGLYQEGSNPEIDSAVAAWPRLQDFLIQPDHEFSDIDSSDAALRDCLAGVTL